MCVCVCVCVCVYAELLLKWRKRKSRTVSSTTHITPLLSPHTFHSHPPANTPSTSNHSPFTCIHTPHSPLLSLPPSPSPSPPAGPPVVEVPSPLIEDDHFGLVSSTLAHPTIPKHFYLDDKTFASHITSHQITLVVFFFHCKNTTVPSLLVPPSLLFSSL